MHFTEYDTRIASYALICDGERVLLSWFSGRGRADRAMWTLPGGGVEYGETFEDAVVREVEEETGYRVRLTGLLTTRTATAPRSEAGRPFQAASVVYTAEVVSGELGTLEVDGTTEFADWVPFAEARDLSRSSAAIGLALDVLAARRAGR